MSHWEQSESCKMSVRVFMNGWRLVFVMDEYENMLYLWNQCTISGKLEWKLFVSFFFNFGRLIILMTDKSKANMLCENI